MTQVFTEYDLYRTPVVEVRRKLIDVDDAVGCVVGASVEIEMKQQKSLEGCRTVRPVFAAEPVRQQSYEGIVPRGFHCPDMHIQEIAVPNGGLLCIRRPLMKDIAI